MHTRLIAADGYIIRHKAFDSLLDTWVSEVFDVDGGMRWISRGQYSGFNHIGDTGGDISKGHETVDLSDTSKECRPSMVMLIKLFKQLTKEW